MKESNKFWYIVGTSLFACLYVVLITFVPIDKEQQRFADTALGFLLGTVLGGGLSYLVGGSALPHTKEPTPKNPIMRQVFWDIPNLTDTIVAINGNGITPTAAQDLKNIDPNFAVLPDDTDIHVLTVETTIPVSITGANDIIYTSVTADFAGGRPSRPR